MLVRPPPLERVGHPPSCQLRTGSVIRQQYGEVDQVYVAIAIKIAEWTAFVVDTTRRGHAGADIIVVENPIAITVRLIEHQVVDAVAAAIPQVPTGEFDSDDSLA